ncbi:MAG: hypothetical protein Q4Q03_07180 [Bowdeniella nasicola]|nr:hypothetical protein [Bowdeniella nasicola]
MIHRIATFGQPTERSTAITTQCAIDAIATHHVALQPGDEILEFGELVDFTLAFSEPSRPLGMPTLVLPPDGHLVIETLAIALRHLISGGTWRGSSIDIRPLPPPQAAMVAQLADIFPLTLLISPDDRLLDVQVGTVRVVDEDDSRTTALGIRQAVNTHAPHVLVNTSAPSITLQTALWCGLLEIAAAPSGVRRTVPPLN